MHLSISCTEQQSKLLSRLFNLFFIAIFLNSLPVQAQRTITTEAGASHRMFSPEDGIPSNAPTNAFTTRDGYLWVSTTGGTVRISGNEIEDFGAEHSLHMMQNIYYDRSGDVIWFTDSETLASFDGEQVRLYGREDGFDAPGGGRRTVSPMLADSQGRLWIGSYTPPFDQPDNGGLLIMENGEFTAYEGKDFPLHNVSGLFEASDGSVWVTSTGYVAGGEFQRESHFARYRDEEFELIDEQSGCQNVATTFRDTEGFTVNMVEDIRGDIWLFCNGIMSAADRAHFGLFRFDGESFFPATPVNEAISGNMSVSNLMYNKTEDELYLSLYNQNGLSVEEVPDLVYVYKDGEWHNDELVSLDRLNELADVFEEGHHVYPGFYFARDQNGELYANLQVVNIGRNSLHSIVFKKEGEQWIWVDTTPGLFLINLAGNTFLTAQNEPDVIGIYTPPFSRLLSEEDGLLKLPVESQSGGSYYRQRFLTDSHGNVWINYVNNWDSETEAWDGMGISFWNGDEVRNITAADGLSHNTIHVIHEASDGSIWMPSENGMNRLVMDGDEFAITAYNRSGGEPFRSTMVVERANGEIFTFANYVAPANENRPDFTFFLARLDGEEFVPFESPFPDSLMAMPFQEYELSADRENRLWLSARFGSNSDALFLAPSHVMIFENEEWNEPPAEWNVPDTRLHYVGELASGRYFVVEGGFTKFDFDQQRFIDLSDSTNANADFRVLKRVNTFGIYFNIETDEHLYIRLRDMGLAVYDGANLTYLDRRDGLPSLRISYPQKDRNEDMLFTTPSGGIIFSGTDFMAVRDDAETGLTARGIARDKNNNILIQHQDIGITVTRIDTLRYPVRLASILADTLRFYEGQSPRLKADQNNLSFRFSTLNFTNPDDVQFSYLLEGYDADWSRPSRANFMEFRNLPSGDYIFNVRSVGPGTVMSDPVSFSFTIAPPWWRTWWAYGIYFLIFLGIVFATDRIQRHRLVRREREKARERELEQAREIEKAYKNLEVAHENLKAAQEQLVQQEKLASLGQLTAGIAHEIKNPLNFVNNFSEVSLELVDEVREELNSQTTNMKRESEKSLRQQAEGKDPSADGEQGDDAELGYTSNPDFILEILDDIEANLRKIHEHGSRADNIVRSMLLHSRGGSGEMEPTHLNSMIKEYVNLAFHGMRAGKEPINVDIELDLDESIGEVPMIAEDFSRVILNLCNNAFDAMREKANVKRETADESVGAIHELPLQDSNYHPKLTVRTHQTEGTVTIEVEDNGPGIPDEIKNNILQPFFTTKKGTQGTGLGLSITNDIIKAHRGKIFTESTENTGTTFTIRIQNNP